MFYPFKASRIYAITSQCTAHSSLSTTQELLPAGNCPSTTCRFCPGVTGSLKKSGSPGCREGNVLLSPGLFLPEQEQSIQRKSHSCPGALQQLNKQEGWYQEVNKPVCYNRNHLHNDQTQEQWTSATITAAGRGELSPIRTDLSSPSPQTLWVDGPLSLYLVLLPQLFGVFLLHLQHSPPLSGILGVVELFQRKVREEMQFGP